MTIKNVVENEIPIDEWPWWRSSHEIVKYHPEAYDENGAYKRQDEWVNIYEIGKYKTWEGDVLTKEEYLKTEEKYVKVATAIMKECGCKRLTIVPFYTNYTEKDIKKASLSKKEYDSFCSILHNINTVRRIDIDEIADYIKLCLREMGYVIVNISHHFLLSASQCYLRIHCNLDKTVLRPIVENEGLYLDPRIRRILIIEE